MNSILEKVLDYLKDHDDLGEYTTLYDFIVGIAPEVLTLTDEEYIDLLSSITDETSDLQQELLEHRIPSNLNSEQIDRISNYISSSDYEFFNKYPMFLTDNRLDSILRGNFDLIGIENKNLVLNYIINHYDEKMINDRVLDFLCSLDLPIDTIEFFRQKGIDISFIISQERLKSSEIIDYLFNTENFYLIDINHISDDLLLKHKDKIYKIPIMANNETIQERLTSILITSQNVMIDESLIDYYINEEKNNQDKNIVIDNLTRNYGDSTILQSYKDKFWSLYFKVIYERNIIPSNFSKAVSSCSQDVFDSYCNELFELYTYNSKARTIFVRGYIEDKLSKSKVPKSDTFKRNLIDKKNFLGLNCFFNEEDTRKYMAELSQILSIDENLYNPCFIHNTELLTGILKNGGKISANCVDEIKTNEEVIEVVKSRLNEYSQDIVSSLSTYLNSFEILELADNTPDFNNIYNYYTTNELDKIMKYVFNNDNYRNYMYKVVDNGLFFEAKKIYELLEKDSGDKEFNTIFFSHIIRNLVDLYELTMNVINSSPSIEDINILYSFYENENIMVADNIKTIEELRNYKRVIYNKNNDVITNSNDITEIKDVIFKLLTNMDLTNMSDIIEYRFSSEKIKSLIRTIKDDEVRNELSQLYPIIKLMEKIIKIENPASIRKIATSFNEKYYKGSRNFTIVSNMFKELESRIKLYYGHDLASTVTNLDTLEESANLVIEKGKYKTQEHDVDDLKIPASEVDLIDFEGEKFTMFVHVLNAYGSGGTIKDFTNPRLKGRTYICLSGLNENSIKCVSQACDDINHVTLLFTDIKPSQFAFSNSVDIYSQGDNNSLELTSMYKNKIEFLPTTETINKTKTNAGDYNEFTIYREDSNGNSIYPTGVFIRGTEPSPSEIDAAAYLGVPLVKINKQLYEEKTNNQQEEKDDTLELIEELNHDQELQENVTYIDLLNELDEIQELQVEENENVNQEGTRTL